MPVRVIRLAPLLAAAALAAALAGCAVQEMLGGGLPTSTPSCAWRLRIEGRATAAQAGLVRCYVRAVARHDLGALKSLVNPDPPRRITNAQLKRSADARAGLATARFTPNPEDSAYAWVRIRYADGASTSFAIVIANPAAISWRMDIGPDAQPGGSAPPPAQP